MVPNKLKSSFYKYKSFLKAKSNQHYDSWSIVVTAKASDVIIKAFVAYHLELDVDKIFLFLDNQDEELTYLNGLDRVEVFYCDENYWNQRDIEISGDHRIRQIYNANYAKSIAKSEWIIHIDIDEYLISEGSVKRLLSLCDTDLVRLRPCEVIFREEPKNYNDVFTSPFKAFLQAGEKRKKLKKRLYGDLPTMRPYWFQGHVEGKVFVKVSSEHILDIHLPITHSKSLITESKIQVAHFFYFGFDDWFKKYERRINPVRLQGFPKKKQDQFLMFQEYLSKGLDKLQSLYKSQCCFDDKQICILEKQKLLVVNRLNIKEKVRNLFGDGTHGLFETFEDVTEVNINEAVLKYDASNSVEEIHLHLGAHKTGSTALQSMLHSNDKELAKQGVAYIYPQQMRESEFLEHKVYALDSNYSYRDFLNGQIRGCRKLLLSEEEVLGRYYSFQNNTIYSESQRNVVNLLSQFPNVKKVNLYLTLREYSSFFESIYLQYIKAHAKKPVHFEEYMAQFAYEEFSWLKVIEGLCQLEFVDKLYIWTYEEYKIDNHYFLNFLMKQLDSSIELSDAKQLNTSISKEALEIINQANNLQTEEFVELKKFLKQNVSREKGYTKAKLFDKKERTALENKYEQDLSTLADVDNDKVCFVKVKEKR